MEKICAVCGQAFRVPPSRATARYCSLACMHVDQVGERNPHWKGGLVTTSCLMCGQPVSVKPSHHKKGAGKTCSSLCAHKLLGQQQRGRGRKRIVKVCKVCGAAVEVKVSHAATAGTYCSVACMAHDYQQRLAGGNNPHWKAGVSSLPSYAAVANRKRKARMLAVGGDHTAAEWEALKAHYAYTCLRCGRREPEIALTFDHVVPVSRGGSNDITNGQPLCQSCNSTKGTQSIDYRK